MRRLVVHFACVAFVLLFGTPPNAHALDAYWKGERNAEWSSGINPTNGVSNWYSQQGEAREVPDGGAVFTLGATRYDIRITALGPTRIFTMLFLKNAPQYSFEIERHSRLVVIGGGIANNSRRTPNFTLRHNARLKLINAARLSSSNSGRAAQIDVQHGAELLFEGNSAGGNAAVTNAGDANFSDNTSAERMVITNLSHSASFSGGKTRFLHRSTGGNAQFTNGRFCYLSFRSTRGPAGDGIVTAKKIDNFGDLFVGTNTLVVRDNFFQDFSGGTGRLRIEVDGARAGKVHVKGEATISGILNVNGYHAAPGNHVLLRADGGRFGEFQLETNIPGAYLSHLPKSIYLFIPPPDDSALR